MLDVKVPSVDIYSFKFKPAPEKPRPRSDGKYDLVEMVAYCYDTAKHYAEIQNFWEQASMLSDMEYYKWRKIYYGY